MKNGFRFLILEKGKKSIVYTCHKIKKACEAVFQAVFQAKTFASRSGPLLAKPHSSVDDIAQRAATSHTTKAGPQSESEYQIRKKRNIGEAKCVANTGPQSVWHKKFSGEVCKVVLPWRGLGLMRSCFDAGSASSLLCRTRCKYSNRSTDKQTRACMQREDPPVTISTTVLWGYGVAAASPCRSCGNLLVMYGSQARSGIHAQPSKGVLRQGESANLQGVPQLVPQL